MKKRLNAIVGKRDVLFAAVFVLALACVRSSVFASYHVPTGSMNPTFLEGDLFFSNKLAYRLKVPFTKTSLVEWAAPSRGDLVIFTYPGDGSLYTKRVIAVAGDIVEIRDKRVIVNGVPVRLEPAGGAPGLRYFTETLDGVSYTVQHDPLRRAASDMPPLSVPPGRVFVMGDNRDNSFDSRYWGTLPVENIEGKMAVRWFSIDWKSLRPRLGRIGLV